MNAAEVIPRDVEGNSGFQIVQLLTESIGQTGKAAQVHTQTQIRSLNVASGDVIVSTVKTMGSQPIRTAFRSPCQNGIAERWVGSVRRDLLDHVIVLNRRHLRRLPNEYVRYYHEDRTHLGLGKDTPGRRVPLSLPASGNRYSVVRLLHAHGGRRPCHAKALLSKEGPYA